ncbi:MAG: permease-like cell division protein FtsX [Burkholderiaceae bacterium]
MTRFDADAVHPAHSTSRDVGAVIAAQPAVFLVTVLVGCIAVVIAIGVLAIGQGVCAQLALAIGRTQVSVFLAPQLARSDAEALRERIEAVPTVSRAVLRTREEALAALAGDGLPALTNKPNPLPDVWIVTLRPKTPGDAEQRLSVAAAAARDALAALPGVASVKVDERWISAIDRWTPLAMRMVTGTNALVFAVLAGFLVALGFVAARAGGAQRADGVGIRAFATTGVLAGAVSILIAAAIVWGLATWIVAAGIDLKPMIDTAGQMLVRLVAAVGGVAILAPLIGMCLGAIRL